MALDEFDLKHKERVGMRTLARRSHCALPVKIEQTWESADPPSKGQASSFFASMRLGHGPCDTCVSAMSFSANQSATRISDGRANPASAVLRGLRCLSEA